MKTRTMYLVGGDFFKEVTVFKIVDGERYRMTIVNSSIADAKKILNEHIAYRWSGIEHVPDNTDDEEVCKLRALEERWRKGEEDLAVDVLHLQTKLWFEGRIRMNGGTYNTAEMWHEFTTVGTLKEFLATVDDDAKIYIKNGRHLYPTGDEEKFGYGTVRGMLGNGLTPPDFLKSELERYGRMGLNPRDLLIYVKSNED